MSPQEAVRAAREEAVGCRWALGLPCPLGYLPAPFTMRRTGEREHEVAHLASLVEREREAAARETWRVSRDHDHAFGSECNFDLGTDCMAATVERIKREGGGP